MWRQRQRPAWPITNERLQQHLRVQGLEDPLTGLHNRRHLMEAGSALLSLLRCRGEPRAVVLIDLDNFKRVNDVHGHETGDLVLKGFAGLARRQTCAEDLACRYGGEEFVLLLPGAQADQADAAPYAAKQAGRGRIEVAVSPRA